MATTNKIVLSVRWSVKYSFCSEFPDIPEKFQQGRKQIAK